jgi:hypothetical protein
VRTMTDIERGLWDLFFEDLQEIRKANSKPG